MGRSLALALAGLVALALAGCAGSSPQSLTGMLTSDGARRKLDDERCQDYGFKRGTDAYANCRLKFEQIRGAADGEVPRARQDAVIEPTALSSGRKVYDTSECIGPVVMGGCKGSIFPNKAYHPTCHGEWLNGQCTGPMF